MTLTSGLQCEYVKYNFIWLYSKQREFYWHAFFSVQQKRQVVCLSKFRTRQHLHTQLRSNCRCLLTTNLRLSHPMQHLRDLELNVAHCKHSQYALLHKLRGLFKMTLRNDDSTRGISTIWLDASETLVDKACVVKDSSFLCIKLTCEKRNTFEAIVWGFRVRPTLANIYIQYFHRPALEHYETRCANHTNISI